MQPENKDRSRKTGLSRARMFMKANLGWLRGYPIEQSGDCVMWARCPRLYSPTPELIRIDGDVIRQTQYTVKKLSTRFPKAMPELVGDVDAWNDRCTQVLQAIKAAVHNGSNIVSDSELLNKLLSQPIRRIRKRLQSRLRTSLPVVDVVCWSTLTDPTVGLQLLKWIERHSDWCEQHARCPTLGSTLTIYLLADLGREDGDIALQAFADILSDARFYEIVTDDFDGVAKDFAGYFERWKRANRQPERPQFPAIRIRSTSTLGVTECEVADSVLAKIGSRKLPLMGPVTERCIMWVANEKATQRRQFFQLWKLLVSTTPLENWSSAWHSLKQILSDGETRLKAVCNIDKHAHRALTMELSCAIKRLAERFLASPVQPIRLPQAIEKMQKLIQTRRTNVVDDVVRLLSSVTGPDAVPLRNVLLLDLVDELDETPLSNWRYGVKLLTAFLQNKAMDGIQDLPWKDELRKWFRGWPRYSFCTPIGVLDCETQSQKNWPIFYDSLAEICAAGEFNPSLLEQLATLADVTGDKDRTLTFTKELSETGRPDEYYDFQLEAAAKLWSDGDDFIGLLQALSRDDVRVSDCSRFVALDGQFQAAGWSGIVTYLLVNQTRRLLTLSRLWQASGMATPQLSKRNGAVASRTSNSSPQIPQRVLQATVSEWASRFPKMLQEQCDILAASFSDGQSRAERILCKLFPSRDVVEREIRSLEALLTAESVSGETDHRRQRLANLKHRLDHPTTPSPAKLRRLSLRLATAEVDLLVQQLTGELRSAIRSVLLQANSVELPITDFDELTGELIAGLSVLKEPYRTTGLKILCAHHGLTSWVPSTHSANQRFLNSLQASGISVEPWLTSQPKICAEHAGETINFRFARCGRDVLLMGYYFGTCLSPDSFNFYSAVTNAVDVNKLVLYAEDASGNVVGRCLLAIGDGGGLVSFRPYCNRSGFSFDKHVANICRKLASSMRTIVHHTDHVSALVMPEWYDDGAIDVGGAAAWEHLQLEKLINNASNASIVGDLESLLAPVEISALTLSIIFSLKAFTKRPELLPPLIPLISQCRPFDNETTLRIAFQLHNGGHDDVARSLLNGRAGWLFERTYSARGEYAFVILKSELRFLAKMYPTQILRVIRRTRLAIIKGDLEERSADRRWLLSQIHEQLGRVKLAEQLRR